jgi:predicted RecB family nuclease
MKGSEGSFCYSATDLVRYLNCRHLSELDRAVAEGSLERPPLRTDLALLALFERGSVHEAEFVERLRATGADVARIEGVDVTGAALGQTLAAMRKGVDVIVQGALSNAPWEGRPDILQRVDVPSALGSWSYQVTDAKLARHTKAGAVLQLCLYSELLRHVQEVEPEFMSIVVPWTNFEPQAYRFTDFAAYFRRARAAFEQGLGAPQRPVTYPEPVEYCEVCRWRGPCEQRRRADDHLSLVAGITKIQINALRQHGVETVRALAGIPVPLSWKPDRGSATSYVRVREQARLQIEARDTGVGRFELLAIEAGFGLCALPEPSTGDIFLDLEGDPFVGERGQEYLFGYVYRDHGGSLAYQGDWALTRQAERLAFERFVDFVMARWEAFSDLHIYHYAPYEPSALKRLMGRYATREEEIDRMLRAGLFVDLYAVVRKALRASVEGYSIKRLEPFYVFNRSTPLDDANPALRRLQVALELQATESIAEGDRDTVLGYNRDDCYSAAGLRDWLEALRSEEVSRGVSVPRRQELLVDGAPSAKTAARLAKIGPLVELLTSDALGVGESPEAQRARWLLGHLLDWHHREGRAVWWEYFRLSDLTEEELLEERAALSGLVFDSVVEAAEGRRTPIHRYWFPEQENEFRGEEQLRSVGGQKFGTVKAISREQRIVDIKKRKDTAEVHAAAVFGHKFVDTDVLADALVRLGEHVVAHGVSGIGPYQAARDLLLREAPRVTSGIAPMSNETVLDTAVRVATHIESSVLPIQGPPGAGKTYTAARMICKLVQEGKRVGITAVSHKVIRNLIDETIEAADASGIGLTCCLKADESEEPTHRLLFAKDNKALVNALAGEAQVGGGTVWLWADEVARGAVDVLFVDEAAQLSLANVLAASQAAHSLVLIGDPQQLEQPVRGTHPEGCEVSAFHHLLGDQQTIDRDKGLFLEETWRLHPEICRFTSEVFYAGRLHSKAGLDQQAVRSTGPVQGAGLRYLPVVHRSNQNASPEEADAIQRLVDAILTTGSTWTDRDGHTRCLELADLLIITPYNAQVFEIQQRLPKARVGTVDKFQGQEAPIAIYSVASSSQADAPRGMEFLYSLNRLNVATSRAQCLSILVASPTIFEAECRSPRQMQMANAFCRFLELATPL